MKFLLLIFSLCTISSSLAQVPDSYFSLYDRKIYSLKNKGVSDFVVDVSSSQLTDQVNQQKSFGEIKELVFRVYWSRSPERLAVEIQGMPEGFIEAKNQLRASFMPLLDNILPMTIEQRFPGYKISPGKSAKEFIAKDSSGLAPIPSYVLKFDELDRLSDITGNKPVGTWNMAWLYEKKAFSEGRWVIGQVTVTDTDNGITTKSTRKLNYGTSQGIGVLSEVVLTIEQSGSKTVRTQENIEFKNYKINTGEGSRYFLSDTPAPSTKPSP